jgi:hypothetical protein
VTYTVAKAMGHDALDGHLINAFISIIKITAHTIFVLIIQPNTVNFKHTG